MAETMDERRVASRRHALAPLAALIVVLALAAVAAAAVTLDGLRADGVVGERYDGYVALRDKDAPAEAKAKVEEVNAKRREIYEKRAREEGVPADQVGRVYAKTIYDEAPAGTWFLTEKDGWVRKP